LILVIIKIKHLQKFFSCLQMRVTGMPSQSNVEPIVSGIAVLVLSVPKCGATVAPNGNSSGVFVLITEEIDVI
jgi:hypothetical protein